MKYRIYEDGGVTITFEPDESNHCTAWLMNAATAEVKNLEETTPPETVQLEHSKDLHFARLMLATLTALCDEKWNDKVVEREYSILNMKPAEERELLDRLHERTEPR